MILSTMESGEKKKNKFKRVNVLIRKAGSVQASYFTGQATSVADKRGYNGSPEFWIINEKGRREKDNNLLLDIPANHVLIEQIKAKRIEQIKAKRIEKEKIDNDIDAISKGFQYLTPEMMEENKED